jgi:hypothetical protein
MQEPTATTFVQPKGALRLRRCIVMQNAYLDQESVPGSFEVPVTTQKASKVLPHPQSGLGIPAFWLHSILPKTSICPKN